MRPPQTVTPRRVRFAPSFREDYALLDAEDRRDVDCLVERLRSRMTGAPVTDRPVVALDEFRMVRSLSVRRDEILSVTDGRVSLDVLCRVGSGEVILLGAAGRDAAMPVPVEALLAG
jgi:hypothetical protein